jgi:hypothetical protein
MGRSAGWSIRAARRSRRCGGADLRARCLGLCQLSGSALIVIGGMLVATVPLRRLMKARGLKLSDRMLARPASPGDRSPVAPSAPASCCSLLMAADSRALPVRPTPRISIGIGLTKLATFGLAGAVTAQVVAVALLIGCVAFPGAFLAKALVDRMPVHLHTALLDAIVAVGGAVMIVNAFMR